METGRLLKFLASLIACLAWMAEDPGIDVLVGYAEGIRDRDMLLEAFRRARANGKPIIFMKVGQTEVGARAAASHTASLAGHDAVYDAVFRQYGVHRVHNTEELLDAAYAASFGIYPQGRRHRPRPAALPSWSHGARRIAGTRRRRPRPVRPGRPCARQRRGRRHRCCRPS